jgi:hypothetical protein
MNRMIKTIVAAAGAGLAGYAAYVASTFARYGRPRIATRADTLLDEFIPQYDVVDRHEARIDAPLHATFAAAREMDFDSSPIVRGIFKGRELIFGTRSEGPPKPKGVLATTLSMGWAVLAEMPDREIVVGAVTKPWEAKPVFHPLLPEDFAAFNEPDYVKIVWTLRVDPTDDGGSVFRTETRAVATDEAARKKFRLYWSFLSPGIILIRSAMLASLRRTIKEHGAHPAGERDVHASWADAT